MTRATVIFACLCLLVGCEVVRQSGQEPMVAPGPIDPITVVRNGGDRVSSLRATFAASVRRGDSTERVRGVLLMSKPDRFRMRLSSLFGFTVLDYLSNAGDDRLWLASAEKTLVGDEISQSGSFSPDSVRWIFLRQRDALPGECTEGGHDSDAVVDCRDADGVRTYVGYVRRDSGLLGSEVLFEHGERRVSIEYDDFRPTGGVRLPYSISWLDALSGAVVDIAIDRYEVDPQLAVGLFAPMAE